MSPVKQEPVEKQPEIVVEQVADEPMREAEPVPTPKPAEVEVKADPAEEKRQSIIYA